MLRNRTPLRYTFLHLTRSATGAGFILPGIRPRPAFHAESRCHNPAPYCQNSAPAPPVHPAQKAPAQSPGTSAGAEASAHRIQRRRRGRILSSRRGCRGSAATAWPAATATPASKDRSCHFSCKALRFHALHSANHTQQTRNCQIFRRLNRIQYTPVHLILQIQAE